MALYIDTAYLDDITNVARTVPLAGVTTNPTILLAAHERGQNFDRQSLIVSLLHLPYIPNGRVFMQPGSIIEEQLFQEALANWQIAQPILGTDTARFIHKIPMSQAGMRVARQLKNMQPTPHIAFTAVTTAAQAYTAAMAGAEFVIPYFNRLERSSIDASARVGEMATLLRNHQLPTRILAASIKSPSEAVSALSAGAHDITAAPQVLLDLVIDPQTDQAIEKFAQDWQKLNN